MNAERILLSTGDLKSAPLAGSFVLSLTPDDKGEILYTPYAGIKKFHSRAALTDQLQRQLNNASEDDDLLALMSLSARKTLAAATSIQMTFEAIQGDVFEDQRSLIANNQRMNEQALLNELIQLPTLDSLLNTQLDGLLKSSFAGLDQRQTRLNFYSAPEGIDDQNAASTRHWITSMSLSEAVLLYYRHQRWPTGQLLEFSHPEKKPGSADRQHWETAIKTASGKLLSLLSTRLKDYWDNASSDGASRRVFFSRAIGEKARADFLIKREANIITPEQSEALHRLIQPTADRPPTLTLETVRLWEYEANHVELAGSLMIGHSGSHAFLYTPTQGLQVLKDYQDLRETLLKKFTAPGHEDEPYRLLSLEERNRFIDFKHPQASGEVISGSIFKTLLEAIITKQLQNMEYALQVFRHSDGIVDIHALFDKALDVRAMFSEQLLALETQGRWSTRPVLSGNQLPSTVRTDKAAAFVKTFSDIQSLTSTEFASQPITSLALQRVYLDNMKPRLAHAISVGIRGEASLRVFNATLRDADRAIVDTVFNPDQPDRKARLALNGFRPDAYSLILEHSGQRDVLPLANCVLLTERGGLDTQHSGRVILWTPAAGLEVFATVSSAKLELNRRLLDAHKCLELLENLTLAQRTFHQRYTLNSLRLIEDNVLQHLAQSSIDHFLARCEHLRSLKLGHTQQTNALKAMTQEVIDTNLRRATLIAQAITRQQSVPAWLGMAPVEEQQLHIELLEQYRNSVSDDKDYLHAIQPLKSYVHDKLGSLLKNRFSGTKLDPDHITITPNLALAGPARTLTEFALTPMNVAQGIGFKIASTTSQALPDTLNQDAVRQLLQSLDIKDDYAKQVTDALTRAGSDADIRKLRFIEQLPWQLLQHAHALKLQQRLGAGAFDLIQQVFNLPDATARASVAGAHAIVRPLELIKTAKSAAVKTLGLYLIGPGAGHKGPQILYAPYHAGSVFTEFDNEASLIAAINTPGLLQDLIIRRLPEGERSLFSNLFKSTVGQQSEITLASTPIGGNLLVQLYNDNVRLLSQLLASQFDIHSQADWEAAKDLFSSGIKLILRLLPGKLAYVQFLWQSYQDFKDSAEGLQDHHWKQALQDFIAGAGQMLTLGRLSLEASATAAPVTSDTAPVASTVVAPQWSQIKPTHPAHTLLRPFETAVVALKDLKKQTSNGTYLDSTSNRTFAPVGGKVYRVANTGPAWRLITDQQQGPALLTAPGQQLVIDPDSHTVHYGKALSKMHNQYVSDRVVKEVLNVEARGMGDIRTRHPEKARVIVNAIDLARYYAFNSLHNLVQLKPLKPGTRLDIFLKAFFDVDTIDASILDKIKKAIVPICTALVDPNEDLMNTERFVVGSNKKELDTTLAFVVHEDSRKTVHFTDRFFNQQLDFYKPFLTEPFDIDGHAQAATVIHEFSHIYSKTVDIATIESRRPFADLLTPIAHFSKKLQKTQLDFQRAALSLATPRAQLFARWDNELGLWNDLDSIKGLDHVGKEILETTACKTMDDARDAFLNPRNANLRIDTILCNADSIAYLICEMGRQLDPVPV